MKTKAMACLVFMILSILAMTGISFAKDAPSDADISGSSNGADSLRTEAHVPGEPERASLPSGPVEPPRERVTVRPSCAYTDAAGGDIVENCQNSQCADGENEYIQVTEDLQQGGTELEVLCGLPEDDPGSLAIDEFHTSAVEVSWPTIAPRTTTLANFPNIFWSDVRTYEEGTGITVADVRLKFIPVLYRWDFGDGETMTLTEPGKPYDPELVKVTQDADRYYKNIHRYTKLGTFDVTLNVVFNGQYSVNGGDWVDIAGSVQATSPPHQLTVREARGELIKPGG